MPQKLEDMISFIEARAATLTKYNGNVRYSHGLGEPQGIKDYGLHVYNEFQPMVELQNRHIGAILTETWTLNMDLIVARPFKSQRASISDSISVEIESIKSTFLHQRNSDAFKDSWWEPDRPLEEGGIYRVPGLLKIEVENTY